MAKKLNVRKDTMKQMLQYVKKHSLFVFFSILFAMAFIAIPPAISSRVLNGSGHFELFLYFLRFAIINTPSILLFFHLIMWQRSPFKCKTHYFYPFHK